MQANTETALTREQFLIDERKKVLKFLADNFDELEEQAQKLTNQNNEDFFYHNTSHAKVADRYIQELGEAAELSELEIVKARLVALYHDTVVGDTAATKPEERDEVKSAQKLAEAVRKILEGNSFDQEAVDQIIAKMQVAILSTTVNKSLAVPVEFKGSSTIVQFDETAHGTNENRRKIAEKLGYEGENLERFVEQMEHADQDLLSQLMCVADLANFTYHDEGIVGVFMLRYGIEIYERGDLEDLSRRELRKIIQGEQVNFRYLLPEEVAGETPDQVLERKKQAIKNCKALVSFLSSQISYFVNYQLPNHLPEQIKTVLSESKRKKALLVATYLEQVQKILKELDF